MQPAFNQPFHFKQDIANSMLYLASDMGRCVNVSVARRGFPAAVAKFPCHA